ncbi:MAG: hypothetical protein IPK83_13780 [Planctomycetes bacterium]|nr:hypothetical protein [Planctomycetota bacterium]
MIELSGMWLFVFPFLTAIMVVLGFLSALIAAAFRPGRRNPESCPICKYNIRGNTSGICPECGVALPAVELRGFNPSLMSRMNAWCRKHATPWHPLLLAPMFFIFGCGVPGWTDWGGVFLGCVFPLVFLTYTYLQAFAMRGRSSLFALLHLAVFVVAGWLGGSMNEEGRGYEFIRLYVVWGLTCAAVVIGALVATFVEWHLRKAAHRQADVIQT